MEQLFKDGYIILPSLISQLTCDKLKQHLETKDSDDLPFNYYQGHNILYLPNDSENFPKEIVFNKEIHDIIKQVFGSSYYMYSYNCNANKSKQDQPYHMDCNHFHPLEAIKKFGSPGPPIQLIVNTYLQDTNEENGSLEVIPGSHLFTDLELGEDGEIDEKYLRDKKMVRLNLPKGSVIIRDKRLWHRGTKNETNKVRYMTGTSYSQNWYKLGKIEFKEDCMELLMDAPFDTWNLYSSPVIW